ncbi:MAG: TrkA family potassium uptake protein [Clostridia bacterium]|nr:TrkA family potassium uptake protein [Clostridia bacterium]
MHIIVIGCGKVGSRLAQIMSEEGHDVVIVDNDRNAFKIIGPDFNGITVTGVPIDQDVLKHAGIETCDALAAVTPDDNVNIMACQVAREIFKVPRVLARIYNPAREQVFHQFGLETICPTNITVDVIRSIILDETGVSNHTIGSNTFSFKHEVVPKELDGKKLSSFKVRRNAAVFGLIRNRMFEFAHPDTTLAAGDTIVISEMMD